MSKYIITYGDEEPQELPDVLDFAISYMKQTIIDCKLPRWRQDALLTQADNMPRAGFSFANNAGQLVKIERVK